MSEEVATSGVTNTTSELDPRSGVLYHFYAYHYFAIPDGALDLINLTDADIHFYNRVSDVIRGSTTQYKLANYLKTYHHSASCLDPNSELDSTRTTAPADDKTFRNEFIWHVKSYNETVEPRSRFYIIGFTPCDMEELLASLHQGGDKEPHAIRTATDACYNVAAPYVDRRSFEGEGTTEGTMEAAIMKCLLDSGDKLNDHATFEGQLGKLAISDADTANVITANAKSDAANSDRTNADTANEH